MFEIIIQKKLKFTKEDLTDILSSCFDGVCYYWAIIDNDREEWNIAENCCTKHDCTVEDIMLWILLNGYNIHLIDKEDNNIEI